VRLSNEFTYKKGTDEMTRILTITMELNDQEAASLLERIKERGAAELADDGVEGPKPEGAVDGHGVIWDARYHASTKTTNADGSWKAKRGMSDQEKADAAAYAEGCKNPTPVPATGSLADDASIPAFLQKDASAVAAAAAPPAPPAAPAMPAAPVVPSPVTYDELLAKFGEVDKDKVMANLAAMYAAAGVTDPATLQTNESQRRLLMNELNELNKL
jgi:hypothetical protein